ncbi:MAG: iron-containing alcohol dehydrogenase [Maritimibacter sp.]|nr:iron-containing alcohol dehydrogenase [Maritimibacter sp.]
MIPPFTFATAGQIRFGRGTAEDGAAAAVLGFGPKVALVHGATDTRARWLIDALHEAGAQVQTLACPGEPTLAALDAARAALQADPPDVVVALGGGAVIDLAKALAALVPSTRPALDHLEVVGRGLPLEAAPLPVVALPTTAGTGAEVTRNAVIGLPDQGVKVSLRDPRMYPDVAIVDSSLMQDAPKAVVLAAGLDAVTQVIEPYVCARANPMTDALARAAIPQGLRALKAVVEGGTPDDWDAMAWTSLAGGLALANAGLGAVHGLAGVIGGVTGAAHGAICGALLVPVIAANRTAAAPDSETHARLDWVAGEIAHVFGSLDGLARWAQSHGLQRLTTLGVAPALRPEIAAKAQAASSMAANPVPLPDAALIEIMAAAG